MSIEVILKYLTHDHIVDAQALTVTDNKGQRRKTRPKTCQLLILLLQNTDKPLSKQTILDTIWADSVVAEQVVFQSIKEIRTLFGESEVIKTIPKQGYIWLPPVSVRTTQKTEDASPLASKPKKQTLLLLSILIALLVGLLFQNISDQKSSFEEKIEGSIIILPNQNRIVGNDHSWVRLGMMDQLIQRLPNSEAKGVLQTDYVLEVLDRAGIEGLDVEEEDIESIFKVSGAEFVVASTLSGSPFDYELSYRFYQKGSKQQGVLFNSDIQPLIDELSGLIASRLGDKKIQIADYHADFNNTLLGRAIELRLEGDLASALPLLKSVVMADEQNITAQRIWIETLFGSQDVKSAGARLAIALPVARASGDVNELTRLLYLNGIYHVQTGEVEASHVYFNEALLLAKNNRDWLYQAYVSETLALLASLEGQYEKAEGLYQKAKSYHQVLKCPVGESNVWARLAELAKRQGDEEGFSTALTNAKKIASERALVKQLAWLNTIK